MPEQHRRERQWSVLRANELTRSSWLLAMTGGPRACSLPRGTSGGRLFSRLQTGDISSPSREIQDQSAGASSPDTWTQRGRRSPYPAEEGPAAVEAAALVGLADQI